jgi:hypothetical protein
VSIGKWLMVLGYKIRCRHDEERVERRTVRSNFFLKTNQKFLKLKLLLICMEVINLKGSNAVEEMASELAPGIPDCQ